MAKQKRLTEEQRKRNIRNCQENYRHRVRRFTFQFSLQDTDARQWFEEQPDKGKYLKCLILADRQRELIRREQERAISRVNRSVAEFIREFPNATLDIMTPGGYVFINPEIMDKAKSEGKIYPHLGSSDTHYAAELSDILSQRINSINPKDDTPNYYYMITDYPEKGE